MLNDDDTMIETTIERDFVDTLEGGCQVPIGVNAKLKDDDTVEVLAIIGMPDGSKSMSKKIIGDIEDFEDISPSEPLTVFFSAYPSGIIPLDVYTESKTNSSRMLNIDVDLEVY